MEKSSNLSALVHLKLHLAARAVIVGIGNTLRSDDGIGSLLAARLEDKTPYIVYDAGASPENYLGKIIKDQPEVILLVDAVDFGGEAGEFRIFEGEEIQAVNFFSTHDASLSLAINYLQESLKTVEVIVLAIQPKALAFGDKLSPQLAQTLETLEKWFINAQNQG